jgi:hypothetical protein
LKRQDDRRTLYLYGGRDCVVGDAIAGAVGLVQPAKEKQYNGDQSNGQGGQLLDKASPLVFGVESISYFSYPFDGTTECFHIIKDTAGLDGSQDLYGLQGNLALLRGLDGRIFCAGRSLLPGGLQQFVIGDANDGGDRLVELLDDVDNLGVMDFV